MPFIKNIDSYAILVKKYSVLYYCSMAENATRTMKKKYPRIKFSINDSKITLSKI